MRRRVVRILDIPAGGLLPALLVTAVAFGLGSLLGGGMAANMGGGDSDSIAFYLQNYMSAAQTGVMDGASIPSIVWETLRWPLFTVLLSFTALGAIGIPVLFAARGFFLSFAVASFVQMFGGAGGIAAFFAFGLTAFVAVPVLFVLGVQGLVAASALAGRFLKGGKRVFPFGRVYALRCALCALVLGLCVLLELFAVPALLRAAVPLF